MRDKDFCTQKAVLCSLQAKQNLMVQWNEMHTAMSFMQSRMQHTKSSALDTGSKVLQDGCSVSIE